jgi:PAS domain S-box-containing protein
MQLVAVPVWSQGRLLGTLTGGFALDDRLAGELREMTHSEVSFAVGERVVASSWPDAERRAVEREVLAGRSPEAGETFTMTLGGESQLGVYGRLGGASASYLVQSSLDRATAYLRALERSLLALGLLVLVAGVALSAAAVRRLTDPLARLAEATRRFAAGDLAWRVPAGPRDEVGQLAASFNEMADSLARSREELSESERLYRDLFDNAQDMVYTTDVDLRITSANRAAARITGYPAESLVGRDLAALLAPASRERLRLLVTSAAAGAEPLPVLEVTLERPDGATVTLEVVSRWLVREGRPFGLHGVARDLTERRARELEAQRFRERLLQTEKLRALGEMAAGVAHNFNNLLTGILGYAQLVAAHPDAPPEVTADAQKIVDTTRRASSVVRRIHTFGRPLDAVERRPVDLARIIRDTVELTRPKWKTEAELGGRRIGVVCDLSPVPAVQSSEAVWEEILSNLVFNAVDALPAGGTITISLREEAGKAVVEVADDGAGMSEDVKRRVFEPFFTTKGPDVGSGLGLSTVWGLVQGEGGTVRIESSPGEGTRFVVEVPLERARAQSGPETAGEVAVAAMRVLVVDDDAATREVLRRLLDGHQVDVAATGEEALRLLAERGYDLVMSDWGMAAASAHELLAEARRRNPGTITLLMSGWALHGTDEPAADLLLQKPIGRQELQQAMRRAGELRSSRGPET